MAEEVCLICQPTHGLYFTSCLEVQAVLVFPTSRHSGEHSGRRCTPIGRRCQPLSTPSRGLPTPQSDQNATRPPAQSKSYCEGSGRVKGRRGVENAWTYVLACWRRECLDLRPGMRVTSSPRNRAQMRPCTCIRMFHAPMHIAIMHLCTHASFRACSMPDRAASDVLAPMCWQCDFGCRCAWSCCCVCMGCAPMRVPMRVLGPMPEGLLRHVRRALQSVE